MTIKVLVVDDSLTVRRYLRTILESDPDVQVVGEAGDGQDAVRLCESTRPDVVTMDLVLPGMSGLAATEYIMAHRPTPILVVSSADNRAELVQTCEALAAGALDALDKPHGDGTDPQWPRRFLRTVKLVSRVKVITHPRGRRITVPDIAPPVPSDDCAVVAVGASTGGPAAIVALLRDLPAAFDLPVLVVLHISEPFGQAFTAWLATQAGRVARPPRDGEPLADCTGQVIVAPPGRHLVVREGRLRLDDGPERHSCRPSVDNLFDSLAREYGARTTACLLTGMGRDGATGLLALRRAGALTIAQDRQTSVVYGMPAEAVRLDAARFVLPLNQIGPVLAAQAARRGRAVR